MELNKLENKSKGEIVALATFIAERVINGEVNPLEVFISAKKNELLISTIIDKIKECAMSEADKHGRSFVFNGASVQLKSGNKSLVYDDDEVYLRLKKELKERKELLDAASKSTAVIIDQYGNDVPRLNEVFAKSTITVSL